MVSKKKIVPAVAVEKLLMKSPLKKIARKKVVVKKKMVTKKATPSPGLFHEGRGIIAEETKTVLIHRHPDACSYPIYAPAGTKAMAIVSTRTSFILGVLLGVAAMSALTFISLVSLYSARNGATPVVNAATIER